MVPHRDDDRDENYARRRDTRVGDLTPPGDVATALD